jgi:hypothetical protein
MRKETIESGLVGPREVESAVIRLLTGEDGSWSRAELEREVGGMHGKPTDVVDAIANLYAWGLVHVDGEFVSATRAAVRMDELHSYRCGDRGEEVMPLG